VVEFVGEILGAVAICEIVEVLLSGEVDLSGRTLMMELVDVICGFCGVVVGEVMVFLRVSGRMR
jgi:hypothetical protein